MTFDIVDRILIKEDGGAEIEVIVRRGQREVRQVNSHFATVTDDFGQGRQRQPTTCYLWDGQTSRELFVGAATISRLRAHAREISNFLEISPGFIEHDLPAKSTMILKD